MESMSIFIRNNKSYHTYDRIKGLVCKILFSLLRKIQSAHNRFASIKKNSFNIYYENLVICPIRKVTAF